MANTTSNNEKSNAPDELDLNMPLPQPAIHGQDVASAATTNKGKEIMVEANQPPPNPNKRKSIVLGGTAHHDDEEHVPKHLKTDGAAANEEEGGGNESTPPSIHQVTTGTIVNSERINDVPQDYICEFRDRRFSSPQALEGHHSGHSMERPIRNEMEAMEQQETMPTQYLLDNYSDDNNNHNLTEYGSFQHGDGTTPRLDAAAADGAFVPHGNNTLPFYPQWAYGTGSIWNNGNGINHFNPGYEAGYCNNAEEYYGSYAAPDPGYFGATYHPQGSLYNYPEFESGYYNGNAAYYNGGGAVGSGYYGGFQQPDSAWMSYERVPIPTAGYYVGLDNNIYALHSGQVDVVPYDPLHQGVTGTSSGNDYLRYQNTGGTQQQVPMDFGSIPEGEGGHGGTEEIQEEGEAIDLTLRL